MPELEQRTCRHATTKLPQRGKRVVTRTLPRSFAAGFCGGSLFVFVADGMGPTNDSVLVVRDALNTMGGILAALRTEFQVREVADAFETIEALKATRYACVVCRLSPAMHAAAFSKIVNSASSSPLVFVAGVDVSTDDLAFLHQANANWLIERLAPRDILALVRSVSA
jgi:hypothetical protein